MTKVWWLVVTLALAGAEARADDAPRDPYPLTIADRPLVIAPAAAELTIGLRAANHDRRTFEDNPTTDFGDLLYLDLFARAAPARNLELYGGISMVVVQPEQLELDLERNKRVDRILTGALLSLSPRMGLALELGVIQPTNATFNQIDTRILVVGRRRLSDTVAADLRGGLRYDRHVRTDQSPLQVSEDASAFYLGGDLRCLVQARTSKLGVEVFLGIFVPISTTVPPELEQRGLGELGTATRVGVRGVYTPTNEVDVFLEIGARDDGQAGNWTEYQIGLSVRVL